MLALTAWRVIGKIRSVLPKLPHPQVALDPGLEVPVKDRDEALGRALQAAFARPPCPLLERVNNGEF